MITIFKSGENGLQTIEKPVDGAWINVTDPTPEEIQQMGELNIPPDFLTYPLDLNERARVEKDEDVTLIILRVPYHQGEGADIPYITVPLGVIQCPSAILTVCSVAHPVLQEFTVRNGRLLNTAKQNRFILRVLFSTANKYLAYLNDINKVVDTLEDKLTASIRNRELMELLKYQKSLEYLSTALKSNELMMERLQRMGLFDKYPEDQELLEDVLTENLQAMEMTNISSSILSNMMDAFASMISNNQNNIIKILTSVTIVVSLPTIVFSFYGMNVDLPFQGTPAAYLATIGIALVLMVPVVILFKVKDWF